MKVHYDISSLPVFNKAVVTVGTFDGVHLGHRQIIDLMRYEAALVNGETIIITFHPHPRQIIQPERSNIYLLNSLSEKIDLIEKLGIDHLIVIPFTDNFAGISAEDYISDFLVKNFHPATIIIGYDHKFGKNRSGDYHLLEEKSLLYKYQLKEIPVQMLQNSTISSTRIREALHQGDVKTANDFLGYRYFLSGLVIEGNKLGRTIGFPTANLQVQNEDKLIPSDGVYAVSIVSNDWADGKKYGMMNIGMRPTVNGTSRTIEVNIFDFDKDIYGKSITISFIQHLRDEIKFDGIESLKAQLTKDKEEASKYINT
jgi:riboflavin kinase / FMN adenylyltransferase